VGARVLFSPDKARGTTDSEGRLQISGIPPGQHRLRLDYLDYQHYEETVDLAAGLNTRPLTLVPGPLSGPSAATTFEVWHIHLKAAHGQLRLSNGTLDFHEDGYNARTDDAFRVACSEIKEVKANGGSSDHLFATGIVGFHVRLRMAPGIE